MSGPPPKDSSRRRRTNKPSKEQIRTQLPPKGRVGATPKPRLASDELCDEDGLCDLCKEYWDTLWHTPQAAAWGKVGYFKASRLLGLWVQFVHRSPSVNVSREMRAIEKDLVLTAESMRLQGWRVADGKGGVVEPEESNQAYRGLRAVE